MRIVTLTMLLALAGSAAVADQLPAPADAAVYIIKPAAGARVKSPVTVVFGLTGMGIAPAGVKVDNTGHFHRPMRPRRCRRPMAYATTARARPKPRSSCRRASTRCSWCSPITPTRRSRPT
jgi:hypothetical protein